MIRIGCSGWNYASWRGGFYPQGLPPARWLEHYASALDTVEVNSTFYRLARREAVARWVRQTPEGFCFALKSSRCRLLMECRAIITGFTMCCRDSKYSVGAASS